MSRRKMLKGIGIAGAAIAVSPAVLAACGDDSGSSAATTGGGGGAATTGGRRRSHHRRVRGAADVQVPRSAKLLEIDAADRGRRHGVQDGRRPRPHRHRLVLRQDHDAAALDLAAKHIEAAGGPKINVIYLDHKSGDAAAGKQAITELGAAKVSGQVRVLRRRPRRHARRHRRSTRCSRSTAAAAPASSARASRTSGAPGRSRRTTRMPGLFK